MSLVFVFVVGCSLALLITVMFYALRNLDIAGSRAYVLQIIFVTVWSVGALFEMFSVTEESMLLWRNIEQIGVFLLPVACVYFAIDYAGYDRLKKYLLLLTIIPLIAILLIFTDAQTHLMRTGYTIVHNQLFGTALSVHQTPLGVLLVSYNYFLVFLALIILFVFSRQVAKSQRNQVMLVLFATALVFILAFFKTAFLEGTRINLPIVTIYLPGGLILYYNLFRNKFLQLSPIAREKVFDVIDIGVVVTHNKGNVTDFNPAAQTILSDSMNIKDPLLGLNLRAIEPLYPTWMQLLKTCTNGTLELAIPGDETDFIEIRVYPLQSGSGRPIGSVSLLRDVTQLRKQEHALRVRANTDSLTSLMNRDSFLKRFDRIFQEYQAVGKPISVFMMDMDKFKNINDTYGHDAGDRVLKSIAELLRSTLREGDAIARIGGDEFAAVLPNVDRLGAAEIANRIIQTAEDHTIEIDQQTRIRMKLSIGICDCQGASTADEMLQNADKAMYIAKDSVEKYSVYSDN